MAGATSNDPQFDREMKNLFNSLGQLFGGFVVMDPTVANNLKDHGYDSKQKLISWLHQGPEDQRPHFRRPEDITLIVTGGQTNLYYHYGSMRYQNTASVDAWR
jgi:hypothetical protein